MNSKFSQFLSFLWDGIKWLTAKIVSLVVLFPIPAAIIAGVLLFIILLWWLWPSSDSVNQRNADEAQTQGITKTAEIDAQSDKVDELIANTKVTETVVANKASVTKTARQRVAEATKVARTATNRTESVQKEPIRDSRIEEVIVNCEKVYPGGCQ